MITVCTSCGGHCSAVGMLWKGENSKQRLCRRCRYHVGKRRSKSFLRKKWARLGIRDSMPSVSHGLIFQRRIFELNERQKRAGRRSLRK